jgi:hypothetical protein
MTHSEILNIAAFTHDYAIDVTAQDGVAAGVFRLRLCG